MTTGTTIDALVLEFGLDHREFTRDSRQVLDELNRFEREAEKTGTRAESQGRKVVDVMSSFRREALSALGLFLGGRGIKEFIDHVTQLDASTGKAARTFNMSARELSTWQGAMQQAGGKAESIRGTMSAISQDMNRFMLTGQGTLPTLLRGPLSMSMVDDNGKLKDAATVILEIVGTLDRLKMEGGARAAFLSLIPGMNEDSMNLMMKSRREIEGLLKVSRDLGGTTAQSAAQAEEFQRALAGLDRSAESLGRTITTKLSPSITKLFDDITENMQKGLRPGIGKGSFLDFLGGKQNHSIFEIEGWREFFKGAGASISGYDPSMDEAKRRLADKFADREADRAASLVKSGPVGGGSNWDRYLRGLSYLETTWSDIKNKDTSAQGYFQFIKGTAKVATDAGIADPRFGSYDQQAAATQAYIKRFYPDAARAIESGDYGKAGVMLKGEWPSLPGGSQPQKRHRYESYSQILQGGGPSGGPTQNISVGTLVVNTQATNGKEVSESIKDYLQNGSLPSQFNAGAE